MGKIGNVFVPYEGNEQAKIMLVGEAPGETEEEKKRPFVGVSGQFLERYLSRCGIKRSDVYLANLCHFRPEWNRFTNLIGTTELEVGLEDLGETIERVDPNVIITLGAWPMYYVTGSTSEKGKPGTGIGSWRGSVIPAVDDHVKGIAGRKVLATYHPAFVARPEGFSNHPIFLLDLQKAVLESKDRSFRYPEYDEMVDPPNVWDIVEEMAEAEWIAVDIETFGYPMACVGFSDGPGRALCVTCNSQYGWKPAQAILESKAPKIFQFGIFDVDYLHHYYQIKTQSYIFDTYIAAANLAPELPKGLDFMTSIYTPFPFYKQERKVWKQTGDLSTYWSYNMKDCIATYMIAMTQMEELEELYGQPIHLEEMKVRAL